MDRIFSLTRVASNQCYPNIEQTSLTPEDRSLFDGLSRQEIEEASCCSLAREKHLRLARQSYESSSVVWRDGPLQDPCNDAPTCSAYNHSGQFAYEYLIASLRKSPCGEFFTNLNDICMSWCSALVAGPQERVNAGLRNTPCVLCNVTNSLPES